MTNQTWRRPPPCRRFPCPLEALPEVNEEELEEWLEVARGEPEVVERLAEVVQEPPEVDEEPGDMLWLD